MSQADISAVLLNRLLHYLDVRGAHALVDVEGVGAVVDGDDLRARVPVSRRCGLVCSTIGAVHHHANSVQWGRHGVMQVGKVALQRVFGFVDDASDPRARGALLRQFQHEGLDLVLHVVFQLVPAGCEELDAVIWHGVVRGGDHHAHVRAEGVREISHGWGGQNAHVEHVHSLRGHARCQRCGEHFAGDSRVASHHGGRSPVAFALVVYEHARCGRAKLHCQWRGEFIVS